MTREPARLSRMLFEARELIDMFGDIVQSRTGKDDDWARRVRDEIDAFRKEQGWNPHGYGGESAPDPVWWFMAVCMECNEGLRNPLAMPFYTEDQRNDWANGHARATEHRILLLNQRRNDPSDTSDPKDTDDTTT